MTLCHIYINNVYNELFSDNIKINVENKIPNTLITLPLTTL